MLGQKFSANMARCHVNFPRTKELKKNLKMSSFILFLVKKIAEAYTRDDVYEVDKWS